MSRLPKGSVGTAAIRIITEMGLAGVGWGDVHVLDEIAEQLRIDANNPFDRHKKILNALERDGRFEKSYFRGCDSSGRREMKVRYLRIKKEEGK